MRFDHLFRAGLLLGVGFGVFILALALFLSAHLSLTLGWR